MRQPDTITRLHHMHDNAREALAFAAGRNREDLDTDRGLELILTRLLEIIGEAASAIPASFRAAYPAIPWRAVIGMRNRLIHAYHDVDRDILWDTVSRNLGPLVTELERILAIEEQAQT
jgi:uncharacterized protein with HEPN domain